MIFKIRNMLGKGLIKLGLIVASKEFAEYFIGMMKTWAAVQEELEKGHEVHFVPYGLEDQPKFKLIKNNDDN